MKKLLTLMCGATLVATSAAWAADFEGTVTMKMTGPRDTPNAVTFSLAKGFTRIDMKSPDGTDAAMIQDHAKQEMLMLMPQQKMYIVRPMPKPGEMVAMTGTTEPSTVEKTSETEKILGYDCVKYISKAADGITHIWVTDQLGTFMGIGGNPMGGSGGRRGGGAQAPQAWEAALRGKDAFPLRVVTKAPDGKEAFRMEATAVNKKAVPASSFAPPGDYQKFDMDGMMRGMGMPAGIRPPGGD